MDKARNEASRANGSDSTVPEANSMSFKSAAHRGNGRTTIAIREIKGLIGSKIARIESYRRI